MGNAPAFPHHAARDHPSWTHLLVAQSSRTSTDGERIDEDGKIGADAGVDAVAAVVGVDENRTDSGSGRSVAPSCDAAESYEAHSCFAQYGLSLQRSAEIEVSLIPW